MAKEKKTEKDEWLEQWRKEHKTKSPEYVKVEYFMKAIEEYVEKCTVTLKGIRGAIESLMKQYAVEGTSDEANFDWYIDHMARFYRDNYNGKEAKDTSLYDLNAGARMRMLYNPDETAMPTHKEFRDLGTPSEAQDDFIIKIDKDGMTVTARTGNVQTNTFAFNGPIQQNNRNMLDWMWDDKYDNGVDALWQDQKAGKISYNELNTGLKNKVNDYQRDNMGGSTKYLTNQWKNNGVPMEITHVKIPKSYE